MMSSWSSEVSGLRGHCFQPSLMLIELRVHGFAAVEPLMPRLAAKVCDEAKHGAFIVSYRFALPLGE